MQLYKSMDFRFVSSSRSSFVGLQTNCWTSSPSSADMSISSGSATIIASLDSLVNWSCMRQPCSPDPAATPLMLKAELSAFLAGGGSGGRLRLLVGFLAFGSVCSALPASYSGEPVAEFCIWGSSIFLAWSPIRPSLGTFCLHRCRCLASPGSRAADGEWQQRAIAGPCGMELFSQGLVGKRLGSLPPYVQGWSATPSRFSCLMSARSLARFLSPFSLHACLSLSREMQEYPKNVSVS